MSFRQKFRPIQLDPQRVAKAEAQGAKVSAEDAAALQAEAAAVDAAPAAAQAVAAPAAAPDTAPSSAPARQAAGAAAAPAAAAPAAVRGLIAAAPDDGVDGEFGTSQTVLYYGPWQVGQVYEVPHECLRPNPVNPRIFYTVDAVENMAQSLLDEGQTTAATGYVEDDHVVLIEGQTRQKACQQLNWPTLRVEIRPKPQSVRTLYETARAANEARSNPSNLDEALRWKELLDTGVYPHQRALAEALRLHEGDVSRVLSLAKMPRSILQALAEVPALLYARTLASIRAYWETCGDDKTLELVVRARARGMSFREIDNLRKAAEKGPYKRPHASRMKVSFGAGKGELKTFEDGRIQLLLEGLSDDEARDLQQRLQKALKV
ncbi:ParB/RepB/Spo0J family partition protein [Azohydromonas lata]|uniref:Chromosome partitioning protein ParB n=1 Tax=Azohydromonas lata TaxID=45677 RepID=A0ABU5IHV8_9BURK|nr:ParB N-terminal domain-containing protein [Azohydromonas lata]MDZ5458076.1 chromosome partitioning protein ParB [Azohydromonas lata]